MYKDFLDDLELMTNNCVKYNGPDHSLTKVAQKMVEMAAEEWKMEKDRIDEAENIFIEYDFDDADTQ